jgi:hypothetical protein
VPAVNPFEAITPRLVVPPLGSRRAPSAASAEGEDDSPPAKRPRSTDVPDDAVPPLVAEVQAAVTALGRPLAKRSVKPPLEYNAGLRLASVDPEIIRLASIAYPKRGGVLDQLHPLYISSVDAGQLAVGLFPQIRRDSESRVLCSDPGCRGMLAVNDIGTFWQVHALPVHAGTVGVLICSSCNTSFKAWSALSRHMREHHSVRPSMIPGQVLIGFNYLASGPASTSMDM